jgi:outer membrane protein TolC
MCRGGPFGPAGRLRRRPRFPHARAAPGRRAVRAGRAVRSPAAGIPETGSDAAFWRQFQDAQLTQLVEQALRANQELRGALARLDAAQALLRESRLDQLPTLTLSGQALQQRRSESQAPSGPRSQRSYSAGINASWELDLFGRVRRSIEAGSADLRASAADLAALQVAIAAQVAASYADLRGWQQRLHLAEANAANQQDTLRLVQLRLAHGSGTDFDLARAQAQLETTRSRIPALQARIAVAQHRLAVLTGQVPEALIAALDAPAALPQLPRPSLPARPPSCCAVAPMWPPPRRVCMPPRRGWAWPRPSCSRACRWAVCWAAPLQHGRAVRGRQRQPQRVPGCGLVFSRRGPRARAHRCQRAGAQVALAQYQQSVLLALEDTENALVLLTRTRTEDAHLAQAAEQRARAEQLAQRRYRLGSVGLYEVLDAQRDLYAAQDAAADSRARGLRAAVALYQALAGGWEGSHRPGL